MHDTHYAMPNDTVITLVVLLILTAVVGLILALAVNIMAAVPVGVFAVVLGIVVLRVRRGHGGDVVLRDDGLAQGSHEISWGDIAAITISPPLPLKAMDATPPHHLKIVQRSGDVIQFHSMLDPTGELSPTIRQHVLKRQLPAMDDHLSAGHVVEFGDISVTPSHINNGTHTLPWRQIEAIKFRGDEGLSIKHLGTWQTWDWIKLDDIPNLDALRTLLARYTIVTDLDGRRIEPPARR